MISMPAAGGKTHRCLPGKFMGDQLRSAQVVATEVSNIIDADAVFDLREPSHRLVLMLIHRDRQCRLWVIFGLSRPTAATSAYGRKADALVHPSHRPHLIDDR